MDRITTNSEVKSLVFNSGQISQTDNGDRIIQELEVRLTLNKDTITSNEHKRMKEMNDRIQRNEELIKDLEEKLSASTLDSSSKELKINEQNHQLEELRNMLVQKSEQIQLQEKEAEKAKEAFSQEKDKLKSAESSLQKIRVLASELRAEIKTKDNEIHDLQSQLRDANSEMVAKLQYIKELELKCNDLKKKSSNVETKISQHEDQLKIKDQNNQQLEDEKEKLIVKMKQMKREVRNKMGKLQDSLNEKVLELDKASKDNEVLNKTINDLKNTHGIERKNYSEQLSSLNDQLAHLKNELAQQAKEQLDLKTKSVLIEKNIDNQNDPSNEIIEITIDEFEGSKPEAKLRLPPQNYKRQSTIQEPIEEMILADNFSIKLNFSDLDRLRGDSWLNDKIINYYLELIALRSANVRTIQRQNWPKCYAMSSFFFSTLRRKGYSAVKRWTKKVDLFSFDMVFIPVNFHESHWCLAVFDMKKQGIYIYDSMGDDHDAVLKILFEYLKKEYVEKKGTQTPFVNISTFKLKNVINTAMQFNFSDCGIYTLKYAEYLSRNATIDFTEEDIETMRRVMIYEILSDTIIYK